jgi:hypothetical protein
MPVFQKKKTSTILPSKVKVEYSSVEQAAFHTQNMIRTDPLSVRAAVHHQISMFASDGRTLTDRETKTQEGISAW